MTNLSIVFPGQGSQSVGMLSEIAQQFPEVLQTFSEASDALGYDVWALAQHGPKEELDKTARTQPALLAASVAIYKILQTRMPNKPAVLAGHSLGEYTALVCANAISFQDAIKLVAARGEYMQDAVPQGTGAMAAIIGLDEAVVAEICQAAVLPHEVLSPANFNSVGQIVIAGHKAAVERALPIAKEKGARLSMLIPVSVPSHCALMQPAAERLSALLATIYIQTPAINIINNVNVATYTSPESIKQGLTQQLFSPVRWVETIQALTKSGVTQIIECGPGKVLTGLIKRIDPSLELLTTNDLTGLEAVLKLETLETA